MEVEPRRLSALRRLTRYVTSGQRDKTVLGKLAHNARYHLLGHYLKNPPEWKIKARIRDQRRRMTAPDFCVVSPPGAGINDLAGHVLQHPCVLVPLVREIPLRRITHEPLTAFPLKEEKEAVEGAHGRAMLGIYSPVMPDLAYPKYLQAWREELKVVLLLRNPVDRAFAHWRADLAHAAAAAGNPAGTRPVLGSFDELCEVELQAARHGALGFTSPRSGGPGYIQTGVYSSFVKDLYDRFAAKNIHLVTAEDFHAAPLEATARIFEFLGLPRCALAELEALDDDWSPRDMSRETRAELLEFYAPLNLALYDIVGRDLGWR